MDNSLSNYLLQLSSSSYLADVILRVNEVISSRRVRKSNCAVIELKDDLKNIFVPKGVILAIIAEEENLSLEKLATGIKQKDFAKINQVAEEIDKVGEAVNELADDAISFTDADEIKGFKIPTIAEIRYGDKSIATYCTVTPKLPFSIHLLPYNGGKLDLKRFGLFEYFDNAGSQKLKCLVLIRKPSLSKAEINALKLVPATSSDLHISSSLSNQFLPVIIAAIVNVARSVLDIFRAPVIPMIFKVTPRLATCTPYFVVHRAIIGGGAERTMIGDKNKLPELLQDLPPEATARELLLMRKKILESYL